MKQKLVNAFVLFILLLFSILYLEILFKLRVLSLDFNIHLFRIGLFSISYSILILFMLMFFKEKTVKISIIVIFIILSFLYLNQEVYHSFVEGFYSFNVVGDFNAGLSFISDYFESLRLWHIAYFLPLIVIILLSKKNLLYYNIEYSTTKQPLIMLGLASLFFFITLQTISSENEIQSLSETDEPLSITTTGTLISFSDIDLYTYVYNNQKALQRFGLLTYTQRDFFTLFRKDPISEQAYDVLIEDYLESQPVHSLNDYSNMFNDKNFILIMAESLDTFAINETLTPNLYALKQEYAYYENYYSPLFYRSTADTEFQVQTSMFPNKNVTLSMDAYQDNTFPNTLPKLFEAKGYSTFSFHNYTDYFYPRGDFHVNTLGYHQYWGSEELGLTVNFNPDNIILNHQWQSDYELMQLAIPKFINEDKFFVNLLTVSGHFQYSNKHEMAKPEYVEAAQNYIDSLDLEVEPAEEIIYYLAVHMEVDKAIGYLIEELENANKLEETVIMIFGDHYAYGINNEDIWDYENAYKDDYDELDIHNVPMMIVSDSNTLKGTQSTYMASIDIMPTVANLFGLDMNYQMVFGHDVYDLEENVIRFANGSFLSNKFSYDAMTQNYLSSDDTISDTYIYNLNTSFINDYIYNVRILEYDYYKKYHTE